jgi:hypothetical protein
MNLSYVHETKTKASLAQYIGRMLGMDQVPTCTINREYRGFSTPTHQLPNKKVIYLVLVVITNSSAFSDIMCFRA